MRVYFCPNCDRQLMVRRDGRKFCYHCFDIVEPGKEEDNSIIYQEAEAGRWITNMLTGNCMFETWGEAKERQDRIEVLSSEESISDYKKRWGEWGEEVRRSREADTLRKQLSKLTQAQILELAKTQGIKIG